jgi:hypothetical protein
VRLATFVSALFSTPRTVMVQKLIECGFEYIRERGAARQLVRE